MEAERLLKNIMTNHYKRRVRAHGGDGRELPDRTKVSRTPRTKGAPF